MKKMARFFGAVALTLSSVALAASMVGKPAPKFEAKNQDGKEFKLESRKDQGYTVLFFYPKAGTPGCTKQACAFRDSIKVIRNEGAEVYGFSADDVAAQKKFHDEHKMTFDLISDAEGKIIQAYDVKMPVVTMAKRQTFVLDKNLIVRRHFENVDPALDAKNVAASIAELKKEDESKSSKK
jgi:peroxiredoxin Q/BCP